MPYFPSSCNPPYLYPCPNKEDLPPGRCRARELSAVLYLEHYEKIEGDVFYKVPKLNEKVEPILGVKFRHLIKTKAPPI